MKFVLYFALGVTAYTFLGALWSGRKAKSSSIPRIVAHRTSARACLILLSAMVAIVETYIRVVGSPQYDTLFFVHLACAIPCLLGVVVLNFYLDGVRHDRAHAPAAYATLSLFAATVATGIPLILRL